MDKNNFEPLLYNLSQSIQQKYIEDPDESIEKNIFYKSFASCKLFLSYTIKI